MKIKEHYKINYKEFGIFIAFFLLVVMLMMISPDAFAKPRNLINILKQASINGILSCGMMFVIIAGGIDLSAGSTIAFSGVIAAYFAQSADTPVIIPVIAAISAGAVIGMINGLGVAYANLPPFIITLATMTGVRGLALIVSGGSPVYGLNKKFEASCQGLRDYWLHPEPYRGLLPQVTDMKWTPLRRWLLAESACQEAPVNGMEPSSELCFWR